ncbi:UNVERIFIED_CONTAM: hypothetical protein GTU68_067140, partial [Idotea baltica]|nr:hypothetical protein [Idotea baltica]
MGSITSRNPATNKPLTTYSLLSNDEVHSTIDFSHTTYLSYRRTSFAERSDMLKKVSVILLSNKDKYALAMTQEMGKTFSSSISEVEKCAWVCQYYADNGAELLADEKIETEATKSYVSYQPLGVILAVMPWNYPFWQVFRFAAPTLMAGNVCLLKHASNVPQCALYIQEIFEEAGFPVGCFNSLLISSDQIPKVLEHEYVQAATLTGSKPAGAAVASAAAGLIKHTVLELGGSDPYIVLEDADIQLAVEACVTSRLLNVGQSCIGAKRFIVVDDVYESFLQKFTDKMKSATLGDPMSDVDLGPMARHDLRDEVHEQVEASIAAGAQLELGGKIPDMEGAFYPPTILTHVKRGMPAYDDEIFGPVASVIRVPNEQEAIRVANDTSFGLGAAVFTRNNNRGERIAKEELEAGCCFVNDFVKSDPRLPFGG